MTRESSGIVEALEVLVLGLGNRVEYLRKLPIHFLSRVGSDNDMVLLSCPFSLSFFRFPSPFCISSTENPHTLMIVPVVVL